MISNQPLRPALVLSSGYQVAILGIKLLRCRGEGEGSNQTRQSGAALPHFGRDGKGGDTCFFCPFDMFFGHFILFFAPMSPDFAHCVTCF